MNGTAIAIRDTSTLTTRELCAATGASQRQIQYWTEQGLLRQEGYCRVPGRSGRASRSRTFLRPELPIARFLKRHATRRGSTCRRVIAAIRRHQMIPPYFVVFDRTGRRVRFAECGLDVIEIAIAAKGGVLVCEVKA